MERKDNSRASGGAVAEPVDPTTRFREIMASNELLLQENKMLSAYLNRLHPTLGDIDESFFADGGLATMQNAFLGAPDDDSKRTGPGKWRGTKQGPQSTTNTLTMTQLANICQEEISLRTKELTEVETKAQKDIADLNAMLGETNIRINELKKETYEFKRDIVMGGENSATRKIIAEKVIRHFEDKLRAKDSLIEKIKLKNNSLKTHIAKLDAQLRQKEEQGDSLRSIDFHQLKIENALFNAKIAEKNSELLSLKMSTGKSVQTLNQAKMTLQQLVAESEQLRRDIRDRQTQLTRFTQELTKVESDFDTAQSSQGKLVAAAALSAKMPQILDYVNQRADHADLVRMVADWTRKVEIAEMASTRARRLASPKSTLKPF